MHLKWPLFILARRAKENLHEDAYRPTRDFTNVWTTCLSPRKWNIARGGLSSNNAKHPKWSSTCAIQIGRRRARRTYCIYSSRRALRRKRRMDGTSVCTSEKKGSARQRVSTKSDMKREREREREREGENAWIHRRMHTRAPHGGNVDESVREGSSVPVRAISWWATSFPSPLVGHASGNHPLLTRPTFHLHPTPPTRGPEKLAWHCGIYYCPPGLTCFDATAANSASQPANHPTSQPDERTNERTDGRTDRHTGKIQLPASRHTASSISNSQRNSVFSLSACVYSLARWNPVYQSCIVKRGIPPSSYCESRNNKAHRLRFHTHMKPDYTRNLHYHSYVTRPRFRGYSLPDFDGIVT